MIEKDLWQKSLGSDASQEALQEHWNTSYEGVLDENTNTQSELRELKNEISWEAKEKEVVTPITREDIDSLTRRNPID